MITELEIRNFKSLRDFNLSMGNINALVGPNLSGKSNIIDAFRFLRDLVSPGPTGAQSLATAFSQRSGFREVAWKGDDNPVIDLLLRGKMRLGNDDANWEYSLRILGNFQWGYANIEAENLWLNAGNRRVALIE